MEITYRFAPEVLEEQEAAAREARFLTLTTRADGTVALRGQLDKEAGALAVAVLGPLAAPAPATDGIPDLRDTGARYADAFIQLCQLATPDLPQVRGERPNVALTMSLESLQAKTPQATGCAPGMLDTGIVVSIEAVRRVLCDANVIPIVLGSHGEPLDIGRATRTIPTGIRRALVARDQGCAFPGCDRPPSWCDAHHCQHWSAGGDTAMLQPVFALRPPPRRRAPRRLAHHHDQRDAMVHPTPMDRPRPNTTTTQPTQDPPTPHVSVREVRESQRRQTARAATSRPCRRGSRASTVLPDIARRFHRRGVGG